MSTEPALRRYDLVEHSSLGLGVVREVFTDGVVVVFPDIRYGNRHSQLCRPDRLRMVFSMDQYDPSPARQAHANALGCPSDIRADGWAVAVHNDYRAMGASHTFWLFTRGDECVKGEGRTDAEALNEVRAALAEKRRREADAEATRQQQVMEARR